MKKILADLIKNIFGFQEKLLEKKYNGGRISLNAEHSMVKNRISNGVNLTISGELDKNRQKVKNDVEEILKNNINNLENILDYSVEFGVKTYKIKNVDKLLKFIDEKEGFIFPEKNFKALYIHLLTDRKISFKSAPLFIFESGKISPYKLVYNFYIWYSYKTNLPGYEEKTREKYKHIFEYEKDEKLNELGYKDIIELQRAIERDKDSMEFTLQFIKTLEGSKNAFNIIKNNDDGANV